MTTFEFSVLTYVLAALCCVGLFSTWLIRRSEGSRRQTASQLLFLATLAGVGLATIYSLLIGGAWLASGSTLSLMVVAGTCEFGCPHAKVARPV